MTIFALVNGLLYEQAKSINVRRSVRNLVSWFDLTSSADDSNLFPIRLGDTIEIVSSERGRLLTGFVEQLEVFQSADSHDVRISGRDKTADLIDSTLKVKQYTGPISLEGLVERVVRDQGLSLKVVNEAGTLPQIRATELISGDIGQSAFDFLERYARRVQAILTSNEKGEIVILRTGPSAGSFSLLRQGLNALTNVLESSLRISSADRYRDYVCRSQLAPATKGFDQKSADVVDQKGEASDEGARAGRFLEFEAETAMDADACAERVKLEVNLRQASSFEYTATVQGVPNGLAVNRLISVFDDFCDVSSILLVTDLDHQFDASSGTTTAIRMSLQNAFSVEESLSSIESTRSETGGGFLS